MARPELDGLLIKVLAVHDDEVREKIDDQLEHPGIIKRGEWCDECGGAIWPHEPHECSGDPET